MSTPIVRSRFSDYAIWQPKLNTDKNGVAKFKVKFPDDVTSWTTGVVAINGNKQSGSILTEVKSFKTLSANIISPQFALMGDSIRLIGKLMNYSVGTESVSRKFVYNSSELLNNKVTFKNAHIDSIYIIAKKTKDASGTGRNAHHHPADASISHSSANNKHWSSLTF
ncbi:MAG: hypothetical protein EOO01_08400 [Chitinophagaceae bacterium]|nr:MAG: hypothetical protein EOO01_08400 [Chitinophagaceae bacterium]